MFSFQIDKYRSDGKCAYLQTYFLKHMKQTQELFHSPTCVLLHSQLLWFKSFGRLINYY